MDLLVALSTGVAYVASIVMMAIDVRTDPEEIMNREDDTMRSYFDAVVFLSFFILMGRALESRARLKVSPTCPPLHDGATDLMDLDWRCYRHAWRATPRNCSPHQLR
jgi:cation transport ATPase